MNHRLPLVVLCGYRTYWVAFICSDALMLPLGSLLSDFFWMQYCHWWRGNSQTPWNSQKCDFFNFFKPSLWSSFDKHPHDQERIFTLRDFCDTNNGRLLSLVGHYGMFQLCKLNTDIDLDLFTLWFSIIVTVSHCVCIYTRCTWAT